MPVQVKLLEPGGSGGCPFTESGCPEKPDMHNISRRQAPKE